MSSVNARSSFQAYVMIGSESTWGTVVAATKDVGYLQDINLSEENGLIQVGAVAQRDIQTNAPGLYKVSGSMTVGFQHGRLLNYLLGSTAHTTSGSDVIHVFTATNSALPSFTLEYGAVGTNTSIYRVQGCKLDSGTLSMGTDGILNLKVDFRGQQASASATAQTYSGQTFPVYSAYAATVSTGAGGSETAVAEVKSFELTVNNNLKDVPTLSQRTIQALTEGGRKYQYTMSLVFASETEHAKFLGGSTSPVNSVLSSQNVVFQVLKDTTAVGSGKRGMFISLGNTNYQSVTTPTAVEGVIYQDFVGYATLLNNASTWDSITSANW